ncbi:hypothetical protein Bacsa_3409 [Phocaeicola salanitronis DSM 18170]|uniref:Lipoprotein n=1 Tax=Phocaeicola salanitronis (strain DSM 18170 / JCM 13657 / CCUG 60908 / BL78) TaxID=667015 RepID=F0R6M9_PHOSB|nr:hypothetical protein [Phocaeicola salanitronis]ADY37934.1 hypothetical protein Bacsa_3409 [Phocaeicola salanitronis DSM 18170]
MRLSIFITLSFLLCTLFCQCNGDIFVEEFAPAATEYTLNGDGDSITIQFASGDWDVSGGYFSSYQPYTWTIYDVIGHPVKVDEQPHWEGLGKCLYDDFLLSVEITRDQYNKLYIKTCENAYKDSISLTLTISNSFTTQLIKIHITPATRYQLSRIEYQLSDFSHETIEKKHGYGSFYNVSNVPTRWGIHVFQNRYNQVWFESLWPAQILAPDTQVEIPCYHPNEVPPLTLSQQKVTYSEEYQNLPLSYSNLMEWIEIPPHCTQDVYTQITYDKVGVFYNLYAINPKTGKERLFSGTFYSRAPRQTDYKIIQETIKE